jgi:hypothetical protein
MRFRKRTDGAIRLGKRAWAVMTAVALLVSASPGRAQESPAVPAPIVRQRATPKPAPPSTAKVRIDSTATVTLEALADSSGDWKPICQSPCDVDVPMDALYRVTGPATVTSRSFHLLPVPNGGRVVLDVDPTSKATPVGTKALRIGGAVTLGVGVALMGADALGTFLCSPGFLGSAGGAPPGGCSNSTLLWSGLAAAAVGATALILGLAMGQSTGVQQSSRRNDAPGGTSAGNDGWIRLPSWRDASPAMGALPTPASAAVFSFAF